MKRIIVGGALGLFLIVQSGCIAVSAKEVKAGTRYDAVAVNGNIYLVDKQTKTARAVAIVEGEQAPNQ